MSILPIALSFAGDVMRNAMISRNQDRAATQTASLSHSAHIRNSNSPIERLPASRQEQHGSQLIANMRNERSENERSLMSAMLKPSRATAS